MLILPRVWKRMEFRDMCGILDTLLRRYLRKPPTKTAATKTTRIWLSSKLQPMAAKSQHSSLNETLIRRRRIGKQMRRRYCVTVRECDDGMCAIVNAILRICN